MTAKVCVRTHVTRGECIRARPGWGVAMDTRRLFTARRRGTACRCRRNRRGRPLKLYALAGCIALPTTTAATRRALFIYTHARTHARAPLFSSRYFSTPIFILSPITPSLSPIAVPKREQH